MKTGAVFPQTESSTDVAPKCDLVQSVKCTGDAYLLCELQVEEDYPHRITAFSQRAMGDA